MAIIVKTSGTHPVNFKPSFENKVGRLSSLSYVPFCRDKLKKPTDDIPLDPAEKHIEQFCHIIRIISPACGKVMDPFT